MPENEGVQQRRGTINFNTTHKAEVNFMLQCFDFGKTAPVHTRQEAGLASLPILMQWYEEEFQLMSIYPVCHKSHSLAEQSYFMRTQPVPTMLFVSLLNCSVQPQCNHIHDLTVLCVHKVLESEMFGVPLQVLLSEGQYYQ
jgi:hypothetical protein